MLSQHSYGLRGYIVSRGEEWVRRKFFHDAFHCDRPARHRKITVTLRHLLHPGRHQSFKKPALPLNGVHMRLRSVDHCHSGGSALGEELSHQLPTMVIVQVQVIHVLSQALRTHHYVSKRVLLLCVKKRVIATILRHDDNASECLISYDFSQITSPSHI